MLTQHLKCLSSPLQNLDSCIVSLSQPFISRLLFVCLLKNSTVLFVTGKFLCKIDVISRVAFQRKRNILLFPLLLLTLKHAAS